MTSPTPGAVSIIQLHGDVIPILEALTGQAQWHAGDLKLCDLGGIDRGLVAVPSKQWAQVTPHGGVRIRQRLLEAMASAGATVVETMSPTETYPEASDPVEAAAMAVIPRAASPLAIDLLLKQSTRWADCDDWSADDEARSRRLDRLLDAPRVVMVGPSNVGKSSLMNTLAGRDVAIAVDEPGTTRDFVSWPVELGGLVVLWHDTPGRRDDPDAIEQEALLLSSQLLDGADMLISATDLGTSWLELPREADLRIGLKSDLGLRQDADLCVSAQTGEGLVELVECIREHLVPANDLASTRPWRFPGLERPLSPDV